MADGSIEFSVELDAKDAERELAAVKKKIIRLEAEMQVKSGKKSALEQELERATFAANQARDKLKKLKAERDRLKGLTFADDNYTDRARLPAVEAQIKEKEELLKDMVKMSDAAAAAMQKYDDDMESINEKLRIQKGLYAELVREAEQLSQPPGGEPDREPSRGASPAAASRAGAALAQRSKNFASQWKRVHSYLANSVGRLRIFSTLTAGIGKTLRRIGSLAGGAFIFSAISQNFRSLRSSMEEMLQTNTNLMMALTRFKGALKTAFLPIYEVAVPALTTLLNLLTRILGVVASFTAAITGKSAKEIKATAAALDQEAEATEGVGSAAKDASKPLASFDEINKLDSKDSGGGGAGAAGAELADIEFPEIDVKSWGELLDGFFDKLLGKLPALEDAFGKFADKLNGFAKKVLEALTFPGLEGKVRALGTGLAKAFNKLVSDIDWYTLGAALGAGFNLALGFLVEMIYGFDWVSLGKALAACFNGFVSQVNWYDLGRMLWAGFKIALETLAGFLLGLDMAQLAEAAGNIVKGFFNAMTETVGSIDWGQIGQQISTALTSFDWKGVASAVAGAFNAVVKALHDAVKNIKWAEIGKDFTLGLNKFLRDVDWKEAGKTVSDAFHGVLEFFKTAARDFDWAGLGKAIGEFIVSIDWGQIGQQIARFLKEIDWKEVLSATWGAIKAAIRAGLELIGGFLKEIGPAAILQAILAIIGAIAAYFPLKAILTSVAAILGKVLAGIVATLTGWPGLIIAAVAAGLVLLIAWFKNGGKDVIAGWLEGISEAMRNIGAWIKEHIVDPFVNFFKDLFGIHSPSTVMAEFGMYLILGLLQGITETWTQIVAFFAQALADLRQWFADAWTSIKTTAETSWNALKTSAETIWTAIKTFFQTTWEAIKTKANEAWTAIKTDLTAKWTDLKQNATTTWNAIKTFFQQTWDAIRQKAAESWNTIKTSLINAWNELKSRASESWNAIKKAIADAWDATRSKTTEIWNAITATLATAWSGIKDKATSAFTAVKDAVLKVWTALGDGIKGVCNSILGGIENWINGIIRGINSLLSVVSDAASAVGSTLGLGNVNLHLSEVRLPRLAQGAVIPPNREFLAVLGDQSQGTNIETPLSTMVEAFRQALGEGGGQRVVVLKIGEREAGRMVVDLFNTETARVGVSV